MKKKENNLWQNINSCLDFLDRYILYNGIFFLCVSERRPKDRRYTFGKGLKALGFPHEVHPRPEQSEGLAGCVAAVL